MTDDHAFDHCALVQLPATDSETFYACRNVSILLMPFAVPFPSVLLVLSGIGLCVAMFLCSQLAYRFGLRRERSVDSQFAVIETATLGLVALLLALTFQLAMTRFEEGRQLIVREVNAIGTAYLRIDLLDSPDLPEMRRLFRTYLDRRVHIYATVAAGENPAEDITQTRELQDQIWKRAVESIPRAPSQAAAILFTPAINAMIDVTTSRFVNFQAQIPALVKALLFGLAIISALVIGYAMGTQKLRSAVPVAIYSVVVAAVIYTVLDLDNPRYGLIRLDAVAQIFEELQISMSEQPKQARASPSIVRISVLFPIDGIRHWPGG